MATEGCAETVPMNVTEKAQKWCDKNGFSEFWEYVSSHDVKVTYNDSSCEDLFNGDEPLMTLAHGDVHAHLYRVADDDDPFFSLRINDKEVLARHKFNIHEIMEVLDISVAYEPDDTLVWEEDVLALAPDAFALMPPVALASLLLELVIYDALTADNNALFMAILDIVEPADPDAEPRTWAEEEENPTNGVMIRALATLAKGEFDHDPDF
jgi:hypothetical protein